MPLSHHSEYYLIGISAENVNKIRSIFFEIQTFKNLYRKHKFSVWEYV